jgi:CheY-like chemotaxis protein
VTINQNSEKKFPNKRVLLVEDNFINQKVASSMMERLEVSVDTAMSGQEAIEKFDSGHYDLIFMDCQMPGMDGFETTLAIRAQEQEKRLSKTVIVALTANAMEGDRKRCLDSGMDDYISKPISLYGISQVLDRWIL